MIAVSNEFYLQVLELGNSVKAGGISFLETRINPLGLRRQAIRSGA